MDTNLTELDLARRMSIGGLLSRVANRLPDKLAFKFGSETRTFGELNARVNQLARALVECGVQRGDRVAVLSHNCIEVVETYVATVRIGAICVPLNFRLAAPEVMYILNDCGAELVVHGAEFTALMQKVSDRLPDLKTRFVIGDNGDDITQAYESALLKMSEADLSIDVSEHDDAFLMYTSGTTGHPKGAVLSHFNLLMNTFNMMLFIGPIIGNDEVELSGNPLFHIAGLNCMLPTLVVGGTSILLPTGEFEPDTVVRMLESEKVTGAYGVPSQWQQICKVKGVKERKFALRRICWGASQAPPSVLVALSEVFPKVQVFNAFGQTEMSSVTCILPGAESVRKRGSVGMALPTVEARIVDDSMHDVADEEVGEIVYRGPTVMQRYWNRPEATAEAFEGGWFHSGDLVRRDSEGFMYVVDRKKDMIISGGENIYCAEVEAAIESHPKVAGVAVIGLPHERWVETPCAIIVATDPTDPPNVVEISEWCSQRLASYKKPTSIVIVEELPQNATGKVMKTLLRERYGAPTFAV